MAFFVLFLLMLLIFILILSRAKIYDRSENEYGITFSKKKATDLGLDWKKTYTDILDGLNIKKLRLPAYWDEIESTEGKYDFKDIDWLIDEAKKRNVKIILAMGGRLPRWPECHFPQWSNSLSAEQRERKIAGYIKNLVERYKNNEAIVDWQIENEPFLIHFGDCPELNKDFLDKEIALVKSLDNRPIIVTDSGELSIWYPAASRADIFGTTMYLDTYSSYLKRYVHYPITPAFFRFKRNLVGMLAHPDEWIVIELQAEPWAPTPFENVAKQERDKTMNPQKFDEIIEFARQAGFKEFYLWGAEWWYWEKETNKDPEMWEKAKLLFNGN